MKKLSLIFTFCLLIIIGAKAQDGPPKVVDTFIELFKKKDFASIYNLYTDDFKQKISPEASSNLLTAVSTDIGPNLKVVIRQPEPGKYACIISGDLNSASADLFVSGVKLSGMRLAPFGPPPNEEVPPLVYPPNNNGRLSRVDKVVDSVVRNYFTANHVSMAIAVIKNGKTYYYGYGQTSKGSHKIPTKKDTYEIGSITKTFTATVLACLVQEGKVDLNKDFRKYLPDLFPGFKEAQTTITVRQLANHTSGLPSFPPFEKPADLKPGDDPYNYYTKAELEHYLKDELPAKTDTGKFAYANLNFAIIGYVLEQVTGSRYSDLVDQYVIKPLDLKNTWLTTDRPISTKGYSAGVEVPYLSLQAMAPAGMIKSNLQDLAIYAEANMNAKGALAVTQQTTFKNDRRQLGLAWIKVKERNTGKEITYHNGGTGGYRSFLGFDASGKTAVIVLTNAVYGDPSALALNLLGKL